MEILKLDKLDSHDRLQELKKQDFDIGECCQNLMDQRPFGSHDFYIFAHTRTDDDGVTKRLIWQPRLTKPKAETNSMLFKTVLPDKVRTIWIIPDENMWDQYEKSKLTESEIVWTSIDKFKKNREALEAKEPDDLSDEVINEIYKDLSIQARMNQKKKTSVKYLD